MSGGDRRKNQDSAVQRQRSMRSPWRKGAACKTNKARESFARYEKRGASK